MDKQLPSGKISQEQYQLSASFLSSKTYIWKNISKIEALKKENSLRKSQTLCQNLQIKYK